MIALVGARAASRSACARASALAGAIVEAGGSVISGGALGVDAAAHEGALDHGGKTWAVLGCGLDVLYPDRHGPLFAAIARSGGLLGEYPAGTQPCAWHFPARNRIIAALADAVVLVEAGLKSGSLHTARYAQKTGRPLLVIPGSSGADALLADGLARPLGTVEDLLDRCQGAPSRQPPLHLLRVLTLLEKPMDPASLAKVLARPVGEVLALLGEAELEGFLCRRPGGCFEVLRVH
jgi:DNA processing protein